MVWHCAICLVCNQAVRDLAAQPGAQSAAARFCTEGAVLAVALRRRFPDLR